MTGPGPLRAAPATRKEKGSVLGNKAALSPAAGPHAPVHPVALPRLAPGIQRCIKQGQGRTSQGVPGAKRDQRP